MLYLISARLNNFHTEHKISDKLQLEDQKINLKNIQLLLFFQRELSFEDL